MLSQPGPLVWLLGKYGQMDYLSVGRSGKAESLGFGECGGLTLLRQNQGAIRGADSGLPIPFGSYCVDSASGTPVSGRLEREPWSLRK